MASSPYHLPNPSSGFPPAGSSTSPFGLASTSPQEPPVTRNRTLFYLSIRDSSSFTPSRGAIGAAAQYGDTIDVDDDERGGLLGGRAGSRTVDMEGLPPKWYGVARTVDVNDEVEEILERLTGKVAVLDRLHAKHVLPGFTDRSAEEREIERHTSDITRDFRKCSSLVTSISPGRGAPRVEAVTAKNVQRGLAQKVQEASALFRKKQRVYMHKLQGHAIKNKDLLAASGAITLRGPDSYDALEEDEEASRTQLQSQNTVAVDIDIAARTSEITQIASSISELADLFRDLGSLVVEQGTVLDSVEYNVQETAKQTEDAVDELLVAKQYQSNSGKRRCILLLVLIIVGLIIVLVYKPRHRGGSDDGASKPEASAWEETGASASASSSGVYNRPPWRPGTFRPTTAAVNKPKITAGRAVVVP